MTSTIDGNRIQILLILARARFYCTKFPISPMDDIYQVEYKNLANSASFSRQTLYVFSLTKNHQRALHDLFLYIDPFFFLDFIMKVW